MLMAVLFLFYNDHHEFYVFFPLLSSLASFLWCVAFRYFSSSRNWMNEWNKWKENFINTLKDIACHFFIHILFDVKALKSIRPSSEVWVPFFCHKLHSAACVYGIEKIKLNNSFLLAWDFFLLLVVLSICCSKLEPSQLVFFAETHTKRTKLFFIVNSKKEYNEAYTKRVTGAYDTHNIDTKIQ